MPYPGNDTGVALVLVDHELQLTFKLGLLLGVWQASRVGCQAGHVLNDEQTDLIASLVEQIRLDFDLIKCEKLLFVGSAMSRTRIYLRACGPCSFQVS